MDFKKLKALAMNDLTQLNALNLSNRAEDRQRAAMIKRVLSKLPTEERLVLEWFAVNRNRGKGGRGIEGRALRSERVRLSIELGIETSGLYRLKDQALLHYYTAFVCAVHSDS